ncbi:hypothetical protein [Acinetobacter modestus]|uniref:hypothetical protein n=1 Tax=Acinetobacter modestus TaxID=1776740 RepID=UPI003209D1CB
MNARQQLEQLNERKSLMEREIELFVRNATAQFESDTGITVKHLNVIYQPTETMGIVVNVRSVTKERF